MSQASRIQVDVFAHVKDWITFSMGHLTHALNVSCGLPEWENNYRLEKLICVLDECQVMFLFVARIEENIDFQRDITYKCIYSLCGCEYSSNFQSSIL